MKLWCSGLSILAMKIVIRIRKSSSLHTLTHTLTRMGNNENNGIYQRNDMKKRCFSLFPIVKKNEKQRFRLCKKISVNSTTVIKNDIASGLKNSRSIFLQYTINTVICQVSSTVSLSGYMTSSSPRTLPQFLSGIVHFFVTSWVARYKAFKSAVSLGNTLLCLFRRR